MSNSTFMGDLKSKSYLRSSSFIVSAEWEAPDFCNQRTTRNKKFLSGMRVDPYDSY